MRGSYRADQLPGRTKNILNSLPKRFKWERRVSLEGYRAKLAENLHTGDWGFPNNKVYPLLTESVSAWNSICLTLWCFETELRKLLIQQFLESVPFPEFTDNWNHSSFSIWFLIVPNSIHVSHLNTELHFKTECRSKAFNLEAIPFESKSKKSYHFEVTGSKWMPSWASAHNQQWR